MKDVTIAMGAIFALGVLAVIKVDVAETVTVLSYVVTALGSLATGHALKK